MNQNSELMNDPILLAKLKKVFPDSNKTADDLINLTTKNMKTDEPIAYLKEFNNELRKLDQFSGARSLGRILGSEAVGGLQFVLALLGSLLISMITIYVVKPPIEKLIKASDMAFLTIMGVAGIPVVIFLLLFSYFGVIRPRLATCEYNRILNESTLFRRVPNYGTINPEETQSADKKQIDDGELIEVRIDP